MMQSRALIVKGWVLLDLGGKPGRYVCVYDTPTGVGGEGGRMGRWSGFAETPIVWGQPGLEKGGRDNEPNFPHSLHKSQCSLYAKKCHFCTGRRYKSRYSESLYEPPSSVR